MLIKKKGMEGQRAKRSYVPWYLLEVPAPRCPIHGCICQVDHTENRSDGSVIQYRYCVHEDCPTSMKTVIPAPTSVNK
jgi:hypothetical protein